MGYEKCGRPEQYPYDKLLDGKPHIVKASKNQIDSIRQGAKRRGLKFSRRKVDAERYEILARVEGDRLPA